MRILGISAFHRDAAAALVVDGQPVAAAREEHFSGRRKDADFPSRAIRFCLEEAGITAGDLDQVVFYEKPLRKFERVLLCQLQAFPRSARSFAHGAFAWLGDRLWIKNRIIKELDVAYDSVLFTEHQLALAANAFYTSPFDDAALLTLDDAGEWATGMLGHATKHGLETHAELQFPHSLGFVASAMTQFLGFTPGHDEFVIETLAEFGTPRFAEALRTLISSDDDGYFTVDERAFRFTFDSEQLFDDPLVDLLGPPRYSGEPLRIDGPEPRHADLACSVQEILEERALALCEKAHDLTLAADLCFAGELATNRRLVAKISRDGPFRTIFIPDAPTKAGGALGAALYAHHCLGSSAGSAASHAQSAVEGPMPTLGESVDDRAEPGAQTIEGKPEDEILRRLLAGQRVAWVRGRVEFGTVSLGNRIVLGNPLQDPTPHRLLGSLQHSEPFLPCRLAMPAAHAAALFPTQPHADQQLRRAQLHTTTADGTAIWPQVVSASHDAPLHALLTQFGTATGTPTLWITDFALRGAPIVRTEADAVAAFERSELDCLIVASRIYAR